jgi:predicted tellurium resistance membrane protein TerC
MSTRRAQPITSLPRSPSDDRRSRMIKYSVAMTIRLVCIILAVFLHSWWSLLIFGIGAVVLPYFAVIVANVGANNEAAVVRPGSVVRVSDLQGPPPRDPQDTQ